MAAFETLKDTELDALVRFKKEGKLDDATLGGLSDSALDALVSLKKQKTKEQQKPVMEGGIDHALPVGFGKGHALSTKEMVDRDIEEHSFGKAVADTWHNMTAPAVERAEKIVNRLGGDVDFSEYYDPKKKRAAQKQEDLSYETYDLVGKLADTRINMAEATPEDVKSYNDALYNIVVTKLGNKDIGFDKSRGEYVVTTKEGKEIPLNKSGIKTLLAQSLGDKYELSGAIAGAKVGFDLSKQSKNPYATIAGTALGSAIGAGTGSLLDTFGNAIETGQKLTATQYANEANKAIALDLAGTAGAPLVAKGMVVGLKGVHKATNTMLAAVDKARAFELNEYAQRKILDDMAKLPEVEQKRYLEALDFAKEHNMQLTSTSVLDHPQIDQLVQVLARNPFIRQGVKHLEAKSRDKLIGKVFDVLESAGPKATPEELDPLLKQELGDALEKRNIKVKELYEDFDKKVSGEVVTKANSLLEDITNIGDKYGFREEGRGLLDEEVAKAEEYVHNIIKPRRDKKLLDAKTLDKVSSNFGKRASAYKVSNPKLYGYYTEAKKVVDNEIEKLSKYEGDEVAQALKDARKAYREKVNIYGNKSEYSEIRKAMESDRPNEAIASLLKGDKGLDNANMLKQELGGSESGDALIGALGRREIDDALANVDMKSPLALSRVLSSDKMKVAKRLLGEEATQTIDNIATLFEMMGRTEKLLAGAGSEIAAASNASLPTKIVKGLEKMLIRLQQKRLFGKVFDNTLAQELLYKTLKVSQHATTPRDFKVVDNFLKRTARTIEKETGEDFSDIYDKRKIKQAEVVERKAKEMEAQALKNEVKNFEVPELAELRAVGKTANNEDVVLLNQSIGRIQQGKQTPADIERYIKARKSLDDESFAKAYEKEKVLELPAKYRGENIEESVANIKELRDYLMSNPELKYGNEFSPASVNALVRDLEKDGVPRSMAHDKLYDELKSMHAALKDRIDEAYPTKQTASTEYVLEEPLDANGNPVFSTPSHLGIGAGTGTVNAFTNADANGDGEVTQEEFVQAFLLGMAGGTVGSKAIAVGLSKVNPELYEKMSKAVDDGVDAEGLVRMFAEKRVKGLARLRGKEKKVIEKVSGKEASELKEMFDWKHPENITRTIDGYQVEHTLKNHGDAVKEEARGNIAVTVDDIDNYMDVVKNYDIKRYGVNHQGKPTVVYGKQINGHYVVVEEVRTGKSDLSFFTMWKSKGKLREDALMLAKEKPQAVRQNTTSSHVESIAQNKKNVKKDTP